MSIEEEDFEFNQDVRNFVDILRSGGIVLYPTDTVWGIGCDATSESAVDKIFKLKKREDSKAMLVLVNSREMLREIVGEISPVYEDLISSDTPTTIIYPHAKGIASILKSTDGSLGIRLCKDRFVDAVCKSLNSPIVSTSANISGETTPKSFNGISEYIKEGVDYIPFYRRNDSDNSAPSRILKIERDGAITVLR